MKQLGHARNPLNPLLVSWVRVDLGFLVDCTLARASTHPGNTDVRACQGNKLNLFIIQGEP